MFRFWQPGEVVEVGGVTYDLSDYSRAKALAVLLMDIPIASFDVLPFLNKKVKRCLLEVIGNEPFIFLKLWEEQRVSLVATSALVHLFCFPRHIGSKALSYQETSSSRELERIHVVISFFKEKELVLDERESYLPLHPFDESVLHRGDAYLRRARAYFQRGFYLEALRDYKIAEQFKLHQEKKNDWKQEINQCYFHLGLYQQAMVDLQRQVKQHPGDPRLRCLFVICLLESPPPCDTPSSSVYRAIVTQSAVNPLSQLNQLLEMGGMDNSTKRLLLSCLLRIDLFQHWRIYDDVKVEGSKLLSVLRALSKEQTFLPLFEAMHKEQGLINQLEKAASKMPHNTLEKAKKEMRAAISAIAAPLPVDAGEEASEEDQSLTLLLPRGKTFEMRALERVPF